MAGGGVEERTIENTPSWALASVCAIFVIFGVIVIIIVDQIEKRLKKARRKPLAHALSKIKEELMQLGFISLLLIVFQSYVQHICIKDSVMDRWNPCPLRDDLYKAETGETSGPAESHSRRLLMISSTNSLDQWLMGSGSGGSAALFRGRMLAGGGESKCKEGYSPIASVDTLHQLHLYLFILACVHIAYSVMSMAISIMRMRRRRDWEELAHLRALEADDDFPAATKVPSAVERNRSFVQHHLSNPLGRNSYSVWIVCFFRQFTQGVTRSDYLTLRHGFISNHGLAKDFDFHKYLKRSMEDEFPNVVGISPFLWGVFLLCMLFNTFNTNLYFWVSFVPFIVLLVVGTKLQHVIATLALDNAGISHHGRYRNSALAPRDDLFWFNRPEIIIFLINYIMFQTAFEMTTFICNIWAFGFDSCIVARLSFMYTRLGLSVVVFLVCSHHTLPLYAVVIQMGSFAGPSIFNKQQDEDSKNWRKEARKKARARIAIVVDGDTGSTTSTHTSSQENSVKQPCQEGEVVERSIDLHCDSFTHRRSKSSRNTNDSSQNQVGSKRSPNRSILKRTISEPIPDPDALPMLRIYLHPDNSLHFTGIEEKKVNTKW